MPDIVQTLAEITGSGGVLTGADVSSRQAGIWRSDTIAAKAIVRPRNTAEVSAVLKTCNDAGQSVIAQGGLTGLVQSAITEPRDIMLSLERMHRVEGVNRTNRTMTVEAGVPLQVVQETADAHDLLFPLDLGARGSCTVGGNISTNAGGNRVIRYGMTRDMVLGLEAVLADGTVVSSMNQMIKNNAGYDLKQLFIGSEGSLGIVTRAVLRLREKPRSQDTLFAAVDSFDKLPELLKHMDARLGGALSAFEVLWSDFYRLVTTPPAQQRPPLPQDYPYYVLIESMGGDADHDGERVQSALAEAYESGLVADAVIAQNESQRREMWAMRDDVEQCNRFPPLFIFDVGLPIPNMEAYVRDVNQLLGESFDTYRNFTFGHLGDGNLHFGISAGEDEESAREAVERAVYEPLKHIGGTISAEHGIGLEKKSYLLITRTPDEVALMRKLKRALDPGDILNPGKIFDPAPALLAS